VKALNARKSAQAKKLIPPNDPNEINDPKLRSASNNSSFTPTNKGMRSLAKPDMNQARQAAWDDIALTAAHDGWSKHEIDAQKKFYNPSEMIALGSLKFNIEPNAKLTKTADAIVAGNRPAWSLPRLAAPYLSIGLIIRPRFWPAKICMCKC
jgi:hypothetical protein